MKELIEELEWQAGPMIVGIALPSVFTAFTMLLAIHSVEPQFLLIGFTFAATAIAFGFIAATGRQTPKPWRHPEEMSIHILFALTLAGCAYASLWALAFIEGIPIPQLLTEQVDALGSMLRGLPDQRGAGRR